MVAQVVERQPLIRLRDIDIGDRVLVEVEGGTAWETVRDVSGEYVQTEENRDGHRMDKIVRYEKQDAAV